jgi:hypothetical protein
MRVYSKFFGRRLNENGVNDKKRKTNAHHVWNSPLRGKRFQLVGKEDLREVRAPRGRQEKEAFEAQSIRRIGWAFFVFKQARINTSVVKIQ